MSSIYNAKNVLHVFPVVDQAPKTSGIVASYSDFTYDGQIAFLRDDNTAISDITNDYGYFRVAVRCGTSVLMSPRIKRANIVSSKTQKYVADTQQVSYIGYNGVSGGFFTPMNSHDYIARITFKGANTLYGTHPFMKDAPFYSSAAATQEEVANGILQSLLLNFKREPMPLIQFDLVNSAPVVTGNRFDYAATVVKGLTTITLATATTYGTGTALAVGDYIRLQGPTASATYLYSPVYKVTAIDTLTVTVDRPITNDSGTYATADVEAEVIPNASLGDFGIKMTGIAETNYKIGDIGHEVVEFNVQLIGFDTNDLITYTTAPVVGKGTYPQVADMFAFAQGNWGKENRLGIPIPVPLSVIVKDGTYCLAHFAYYQDEAAYLTGSQPKSLGEVILAFAFTPSTYTNPNLCLAVLQNDSTHFNGSGSFPDFS